MFVKQISVFLENKPGRLSAFINVLAQNHIDLQALMVAETQEYGIARVIVNRPEEAKALLTEASYAFSVNEVLSVTVPDEPGSLTKILSILADSGVSISYSYAFYAREQGKAKIVIRVDDNEAAESLLKSNGLTE